MLTGVMTLMMSNGGDAEGAFLYGVDRAYMTVFGVVVYTLVGTFLFPTKTEQNLRQLIEQLNQAQRALFTAILQNFEQKSAGQSLLKKAEKKIQKRKSHNLLAWTLSSNRCLPLKMRSNSVLPRSVWNAVTCRPT